MFQNKCDNGICDIYEINRAVVIQIKNINETPIYSFYE